MQLFEYIDILNQPYDIFLQIPFIRRSIGIITAK